MRVFVKDYDKEVEFPEGTTPEVMTEALKRNFPPLISTMKPEPKRTMPTYEELGLPAPATQPEWRNPVGTGRVPVSTSEAIHGVATEAKGAVQVPMMAGIGMGMATHPIGTAVALASFMGLNELKNLAVSKIGGMDYQFQGGKGMSDLLKMEGLSADAVDLLEFAAEAWGAGKISGLTKVLADAVKRTPEPKAKIELINDVAKEVKETGKTIDEVVATKAGRPVEPVPEEIAIEKPVKPTVIEEPTPSLESMEAQIKGGAIRGTEKYATGSAINLKRLDTTEDVKTFIDMRTQQLADKIDKKTVSWEETEAAARELGLDWKDAVKHSNKIQDLTAWVQATREVQMTMGQQLFDKIRNLPADRSLITPEMKLDILSDIGNHGEVLTATSKMSSEIGRALNIHKKMMASDPDFVQQVGINKIMQEIIKKGNLEKEFDNIIADLKAIDINDLKAVNAVIQKYHKAGIMDMIYEGWLNFILSAPKTQLVNISGSLIAASAKTFGEIPIAATLELLRGGDRKVFFGETTAEVFGALRGVAEAGRSFVKAFKTEEASDLWTKAEIAYPKAIPGLTGQIIRIPTRALLAVDEFFKTLIYRGSMNRQAYSIAHQEKLKGEDLATRIASLLESPPESMTSKAHTEALYQTFNKPLGEIGQTMMKLRTALPGRIGYFLVPFIRTITNLTKYAAERTPFNFAKIGYDYAKGNIPKDELSNEIAKPLFGSVMVLTAATLVNEGYITGSGPKDKSKRETLMRTGWLPYGFKIGGKYISYNRYDPLGQIIGTAADIAEAVLNKPFPDDNETKNMVTRMALSLSRNWVSKTYMQGISGIIDAVSDPVRYGENFIENFAGSLIPSMVASVAKADDPYFRSVEGVKEALQSRIPGQSEKLFPKRDIWGQPIERKGNFTTRMLAPSDVSTELNDKVNTEMVRLGIHSDPVQKKIRGIELTPAEYDLYAEKAGERARAIVERYVESDAYEGRRDEINKLNISNLITKARDIESTRIWVAMDRDRRMESINKKYGKTPQEVQNE